MKRVIVATSKAAKTYYHYDNRKFRVGEHITKSYQLSKLVVDAYQEFSNIRNPNSLVYLLDHLDEDYSYDYNHLYQVQPDGAVSERLMDYSPVVCQLEVKNWVTKNIITNTDDCKYVCKLFAQAYDGSVEAIQQLHSYGYTKSDRVEYVAESAKVVKVIK